MPAVIPEWRDGTRPANACGGLVVPDCDEATLPPTLFCRIRFNDQVEDFVITYDPAQHRWAGLAPESTGSCGTASVTVRCNQNPTGVPPARRWLVQMSSNIPSGTVTDFAEFQQADPPTPFLWTVGLIEHQQACGGAPGGAPTLEVSSDPIHGH